MRRRSVPRQGDQVGAIDSRQKTSANHAAKPNPKIEAWQATFRIINDSGYTFENQSFRASGLSLIAAAIVHWNTVYLDRAVRQLCAQGVAVPDDLLAHVAPLGWEHIGLTGDYVWTEANRRFGRCARFVLCSSQWPLSVRF
jgi:hypothetical protein